MRKEKSDARELKFFNQRKQSMDALEIIYVLSQVLKAVLSGAGPKGLASSEYIEEKSSSYCSYNILPLDPKDQGCYFIYPKSTNIQRLYKTVIKTVQNCHIFMNLVRCRAWLLDMNFIRSMLPHLYDTHMMEQYKGTTFGELSSHVFTVVDVELHEGDQAWKDHFDGRIKGFREQKFTWLSKIAVGLFRFSKGFLSMEGCDELNLLFQKIGDIVKFDLNALQDNTIYAMESGEVFGILAMLEIS